MITSGINEHDVEIAALAFLQGVGWEISHGPDLAPGAPVLRAE